MLRGKKGHLRRAVVVLSTIFVSEPSKSVRSEVLLLNNGIKHLKHFKSIGESAGKTRKQLVHMGRIKNGSLSPIELKAVRSVAAGLS